MRYVYQPQVPTREYQYEHGYALIDTASGKQVGWTAFEQRAASSAAELNADPLEPAPSEVEVHDVR